RSYTMPQGPPEDNSPHCANHTALNQTGIFMFQIKRMKDLEIEKDALWCGMEILEKARLWYIQRLQENRAQQENTAQRERIVHSCLLRSRIQRVNGSLGAVMSDPNGISIRKPNLSEAEADSDLRWQNSVLTQVRTIR
uniref:Uncharacterized protein n=1 Tax=Gouania willdenowi TaxID=441366 RepID=A0A8C5HUE6_GOUWI